MRQICQLWQQRHKKYSPLFAALVSKVILEFCFLCSFTFCLQLNLSRSLSEARLLFSYYPLFSQKRYFLKKKEKFCLQKSLFFAFAGWQSYWSGFQTKQDCETQFNFKSPSAAAAAASEASSLPIANGPFNQNPWCFNQVKWTHTTDQISNKIWNQRSFWFIDCSLCRIFFIEDFLMLSNF